VDDRYVVWYVLDAECVKQLYIYDTQTGAEPMHLSIPLNMRVDHGMYLANGKVMLLTDTGPCVIVCVDLATGGITTLQN
jgi:hypothetical protein